MGTEFEKKFLLFENGEPHAAERFLADIGAVRTVYERVLETGDRIKQGYLPLDIGLIVAGALEMRYDFTPKEARLRQRTRHAGGIEHYFTLKGDGGSSRPEQELIIDHLVFDTHWGQTQGSRIAKARLKHPYGDLVVEIDAYMDGRDLMVAEVEVPTEPLLALIPLLGRDITEEKRYKNKNLAK
jgi:CYTH domain-containing protein